MKAARLVRYKTPYDIQEVDLPTLQENDLLVQVGAAGYCHTDYQVYVGVYGSQCPLTPSHEPVGTVVQVGSAVQHFKRGDRVGVLLFRHACGSCLACRTTLAEQGRVDPRFCETISMAGIKDDGAMAEYIVADAENTVKLPDSVAFEQGAPLMCAGTTVWGGIEKAQLRPNSRVGVIGIGGLGSLAVQFLKALGHQVVAVDNRQEGLDLATEPSQKADLVVDSRSDTAVDEIVHWAGHGGLAAVIVCTDNVSVNGWSLKLLAAHGKCIVLGLPVDPLQFNAFDLVFKEIAIIGSLVATIEQARDMMVVVDRFHIRSHVRTLRLEDAPNLPSLYMDPHLKGRLVVKF
ncbi:alcohol dehydrogenase GroES-like domain-containing protein [Aspergillus aculeatinus CBS 121060]|uniref:Alcohol dehydrogenase GroES-like domain-containing protein n=1 Tax=Aspergillus aculeatinus CBS 121060 TaxID=1448322 RepID=A0ACD1H2A2_9EURO|nr:alcohol dehydrogenase GroES-like domain-containing protein [Aspergillus aculeatinus CBS 121060]RAH67551.1 alcohol dehydrogenase GroES-like domain-containing protein [Aspergillus aculeatinus CBS 121060]